MTENQKRILKKIGKVAAYTAITGGAYVLARGTLSLILKQIEPKDKAESITPESRHDAEQGRVVISPARNITRSR